MMTKQAHNFSILISTDAMYVEYSDRIIIASYVSRRPGECIVLEENKHQEIVFKLLTL